MDYILRDINITGEITNLNFHKNGNIYFSLKDKFARIDAMASQEDIKINLFDGAKVMAKGTVTYYDSCLLYTSPSPRDRTRSRMPSSA